MLKTRFASLDSPSWDHKLDFELSALNKLNLISALGDSPENTAGNGNPGNGEITAAERQAYRHLVIGLSASLPTWAVPKDRLLAYIGKCRGFDLDSWTFFLWGPKWAMSALNTTKVLIYEVHESGSIVATG